MAHYFRRRRYCRFTEEGIEQVALVIGAEGAGMRRLISEKCDELLKLPMSGEMASLNASVATGIGLFEAVRQRQNINY